MFLQVQTMAMAIEFDLLSSINKVYPMYLTFKSANHGPHL